MSRGLDRITLHGLRARGHHGVLTAERELGQEFSADLVLHLDTRPAGASDDLAATVSYAEVAEDVVAVLGGEPVDLLETLAQRIATTVLTNPGVARVEVTVHKPQAPITVAFDDVTLSIDRSATERDGARDAGPGAAEPHHEAVLALGGNLGDVPATMATAVRALGAHPRISATAVSPLARTAAVLLPGQEPQPDYRNAVMIVRTSLAPRELLAACQGIEVALGRVRHERWGARPLDIDLIAAGEVTWRDDMLELPHPRAHERDFVLEPWVRLDPEARLVGHGSVVELLSNLRCEAGAGGLQWEGQWDGDGWAPRAVPDGPERG